MTLASFYSRLVINEQFSDNYIAALADVQCSHRDGPAGCMVCLYRGTLISRTTRDKNISQMGEIIRAFIVPTGTDSIQVYVGGELLFDKEVCDGRVELSADEVIPHHLMTSRRLSVQPVDVIVEYILLGDFAKAQMREFHVGMYERFSRVRLVTPA